MIDIMLQQGVLALVYEQKQMIRLASEAQLKYLSFLSHDLANNFLLISSNLEVLRRNLDKRSDMQDSTEMISAALASMHRTREGMRRLLEHEHLRHSKTRPRVIAVNLMQVAEPVIVLAASDALGKGMRVEMDINPHANVLTNPDLLTVILQNLVGNAIKHSARSAESRNSPGGCVRVTTRREGESWILSVTDEGPGISPEHLDRLFKAFEQLPQPEPGTDPDRGFGLGLAIASQAARLLDTVIEVETRSGVGSTFSARFPSAPRDTGTKD